MILEHNTQLPGEPRGDTGYPVLTALEMGDIIDRYPGDFEMIQAAAVAYMLDVTIAVYGGYSDDDPRRVEAEQELDDQLNNRGQLDVTEDGWTVTLAEPIRNRGREVTQVKMRFPTKAADRLAINAPARARLTDQGRNRYKIANLCGLPLPLINLMAAGDFFLLVELVNDYVAEASRLRRR